MLMAYNYKSVSYGAGTVGFNGYGDREILFHRVNPRIQVEHTVTEEISGIDIVQAQILKPKEKVWSKQPEKIRSQKLF